MPSLSKHLYKRFLDSARNDNHYPIIMKTKIFFSILISVFVTLVPMFIGIEGSFAAKPVGHKSNGSKQNPQQSAQNTGGAKLIEKVTKKPGELIIPYEKWQLPNGMTIVIHEDHSDPILYFDVTYHGKSVV